MINEFKEANANTMRSELCMQKGISFIDNNRIKEFHLGKIAFEQVR